jgi:hypothetical protein
VSTDFRAAPFPDRCERASAAHISISTVGSVVVGKRILRQCRRPRRAGSNRGRRRASWPRPHRRQAGVALAPLGRTWPSHGRVRHRRATASWSGWSGSGGLSVGRRSTATYPMEAASASQRSALGPELDTAHSFAMVERGSVRRDAESRLPKGILAAFAARRASSACRISPVGSPGGRTRRTRRSGHRRRARNRARDGSRSGARGSPRRGRRP